MWQQQYHNLIHGLSREQNHRRSRQAVVAELIHVILTLLILFILTIVIATIDPSHADQNSSSKVVVAAVVAVFLEIAVVKHHTNTAARSVEQTRQHEASSSHAVHVIRTKVAVRCCQGRCELFLGIIYCYTISEVILILFVREEKNRVISQQQLIYIIKLKKKYLTKWNSYTIIYVRTTNRQ